MASKYQMSFPHSSVSVLMKSEGNSCRPSGEQDSLGPIEFSLNPASVNISTMVSSYTGKTVKANVVRSEFLKLNLQWHKSFHGCSARIS